jgi:transcriptional regulator with XRE-family HTH domain
MSTALALDEPMTTDPKQIQDIASAYASYVGTYLRIERKRLKLTLREVAERTGRSTSWAGQVERGENNDATSQKLYALALGTSLAIIVARAEHQQALDVELGQTSAFGRSSAAPDDDDEPR